MIAGKKLLIGLFCFSSMGAIAQEKGDIGVLLSTDNLTRFGFEYRTPLGEQFKWKIGATTGGYWNFNPKNDIVSTTDSTVIMRQVHLNVQQFTFRFGAERQLKQSIFSVGLDLNLGYLSKFYGERNTAEGLNEQGEWVFADIVSEEEYSEGIFTPGFERPIAIGDYDRTSVKRHFLNTDLRLSLNIDAAMGKSFLIHASVAGVFGVPIYMGTTILEDPKNNYGGVPPSVFNFNTNINVGIRYLLGSRTKKS